MPPAKSDTTMPAADRELDSINDLNASIADAMKVVVLEKTQVKYGRPVRYTNP